LSRSAQRRTALRGGVSVTAAARRLAQAVCSAEGGRTCAAPRPAQHPPAACGYHFNATPPFCTPCTSAAILPWNGLPRGFSNKTAAEGTNQRQCRQMRHGRDRSSVHMDAQSSHGTHNQRQPPCCAPQAARLRQAIARTSALCARPHASCPRVSARRWRSALRTNFRGSRHVCVVGQRLAQRFLDGGRSRHDLGSTQTMQSALTLPLTTRWVGFLWRATRTTPSARRCTCA
jgi:hypothetical protein